MSSQANKRHYCIRENDWFVRKIALKMFVCSAKANVLLSCSIVTSPKIELETFRSNSLSQLTGLSHSLFQCGFMNERDGAHCHKKRRR